VPFNRHDDLFGDRLTVFEILEIDQYRRIQIVTIGDLLEVESNANPSRVVSS
jgi:hypothetical protein